MAELCGMGHVQFTPPLLPSLLYHALPFGHGIDHPDGMTLFPIE
jgi:hypothetical protein